MYKILQIKLLLSFYKKYYYLKEELKYGQEYVHINMDFTQRLSPIHARYCPADIYLFKFNNQNSKTMCEVFSK